MRTQTLSVVKGQFRNRVSWADLADAEELEEECKRSRLKCDDCELKFASRNQLFAHVRNTCSVIPSGHGVRSDAKGLACAADRPGKSYKQDAVRYAQPQTPSRRPTSRYDVCEAFSPAWVSSVAEKRELRGGLVF